MQDACPQNMNYKANRSYKGEWETVNGETDLLIFFPITVKLIFLSIKAKPVLLCSVQE
jgi:hypothetical protein